MERVVKVDWRGNLAMSNGRGTHRVTMDVLDREVCQEVIYRLSFCYGDSSGTGSYGESINAPKGISKYQKRIAGKHFLRAQHILKGILDNETMKALGMRSMGRVHNSTFKHRWVTPRVQ